MNTEIHNPFIPMRVRHLEHYAASSMHLFGPGIQAGAEEKPNSQMLWDTSCEFT